MCWLPVNMASDESWVCGEGERQLSWDSDTGSLAVYVDG